MDLCILLGIACLSSLTVGYALSMFLISRSHIIYDLNIIKEDIILLNVNMEKLLNLRK